MNELIGYLQENDYSLKEELVLKIAILAEKFALILNWYIDIVVKLIEHAGDYVSEDIWFRVTQIVTGFGDAEPNLELQKYAAQKLFAALQVPHVHETLVKLGSYIIAEFGFLVADEPGRDFVRQFETLAKHFPNCSARARGMILNAYIKIARMSPAARALTLTAFRANADYWDEDIQQRACEYIRLLEQIEGGGADGDLADQALEKMPTFSDEL